jgi:hypothetical protein
MAAGQVDNAQASMSQADLATSIDSAIVRSAMPDRAEHLGDQIRIRGTAIEI